MDLYHVALFAHILGAVVVVGSGFFLPFVTAGAARATSLDSFRDWANVVLRVSKGAGMSAAVILISGLYMGISGRLFNRGWLVVSLVLFVVNGALAGAVMDKHWKNVMARAQEAGDGAVPHDIRALTSTPRTHMVESYMLASDLAVVFLMTNKPGWTGSLVTVVVGLALTAALVARGRESRTSSPAVAG